jgi:hypothetical protein
MIGLVLIVLGKDDNMVRIVRFGFFFLPTAYLDRQECLLAQVRESLNRSVRKAYIKIAPIQSCRMTKEK